MPARRPKPSRPSDLFAKRIREVRTARRWSQADLAERLAEMGYPIDRSALARIERGARRVSLDDTMAIAAALGPALVEMVVPRSPEAPVAMGGRWVVLAHRLRAWMAGDMPLRDEDGPTFLGQSSYPLFEGPVGVRGLRDPVFRIHAALGDEEWGNALDAVDELRIELERVEKLIKLRQKKETP